MLGLLLKVNFSQEKLSLYSLMLVFDTMGTSSPEMVPAVKGGREKEEKKRKKKVRDQRVDISGTRPTGAQTYH